MSLRMGIRKAVLTNPSCPPMSGSLGLSGQSPFLHKEST